MCNKAVKTYPSSIEIVSDQFKTQEICDKAVDTCRFVFYSVFDQYITQELCDKVFSEDPFMLKDCPDKQKTQEMFCKAVDSCLLASKFVPDWFVKNEIIEKPDSAIFCDDYIVFGKLDSDFVTFFSKDIDLNSITLANINLGDDHHAMLMG